MAENTRFVSLDAQAETIGWRYHKGIAPRAIVPILCQRGRGWLLKKPGKDIGNRVPSGEPALL